MKILITGGAGMIGSNLVSELLKKDHEITIIDNFWRGSIENLKFTCGNHFSKIKIINDDLSVLGEWTKYFNDIDCVYHLADIVAGIDYVFSNEAFVFRKNLLINVNVSNAIEKSNVKKYIYVGTACSFPKHLQLNAEAAPLKEIDQYPAYPESGYGWSKLMGEIDLEYIAKNSNKTCITLVLHNVYGTPCEFSSNRAQVIPSLIYKSLTSSDGNLNVWGNGSQGRAFVHVHDVVNALQQCLVVEYNTGVIQIGPSKCTTIEQIAKSINYISNKNLQIVFDLNKPSGDGGRSADYSKAKKILDWEPSIELNEGLKEIYKYIEEKINKK
jgi:GDP-D-mannose 3',5'-epimerase